ncbi:MAG: hypothetical protein E7015_01695 [Alphaproteobacteria bacterium]|nr:hypothetical protein [Alphaproteobacteria bacterium]
MLIVLLKSTQLAENTGMAMRAMINTGVTELRLISPQHGWPNTTAHLASAEKSHLLNVNVFASIEDAIQDLNIVFAATARRRNMISRIYSPDIISEYNNSPNRIGVLFGNEKSGLSNADVSLCNAVIEIPNSGFSSYNLAQAVLLICYQNFMKPKLNEVHLGKTVPSSQKHVDALVNLLEQKLEKKHYFPSSDKQILMMQTIRNFFKRSIPTLQEIQSLFGAISSLQ